VGFKRGRKKSWMLKGMDGNYWNGGRTFMVYTVGCFGNYQLCSQPFIMDHQAWCGVVLNAIVANISTFI
jgi:hypothetical protein